MPTSTDADLTAEFGTPLTDVQEQIRANLWTRALPHLTDDGQAAADLPLAYLVGTGCGDRAIRFVDALAARDIAGAVAAADVGVPAGRRMRARGIMGSTDWSGFLAHVAYIAEESPSVLFAVSP